MLWPKQKIEVAERENVAKKENVNKENLGEVGARARRRLLGMT